MERKKNIKSIRQYKLDHNNSYPKQSCKLSFEYLLLNHPHRYKFDYECDENDSDFSYLSIIYKIIEKYNPLFATRRNTSHLHSFLLRYLRVETPDDISNKINNYFVGYCMSLTCQTPSSKCTPTSSSSTNNNNHSSQDYSSASPSLHNLKSYNMSRGGSILRDPRYSKRIRGESLNYDSSLNKTGISVNFSFNPQKINVKSKSKGNETLYVDV